MEPFEAVDAVVDGEAWAEGVGEGAKAGERGNGGGGWRVHGGEVVGGVGEFKGGISDL